MRGVLIEKAISILERKFFGLFGDIFSACSFELIFKCPEDHFEEKKVLSWSFSWLTTFGVWAKIFGISDSNLPSGLSKLESMCQWSFYHETKDFEKIYIITITFGFQTAIFQVWVKKILASLSVLHSICLEKNFERINCGKQTLSHCFFLKKFLLFSLFCEFTQIFLGSVPRTELYVSTGLSSWEVFSLKKKFQNVFQFVGQSFSGLWQNVFCTVVRTAFFVSSGTIHGEKFLRNLVSLHEEVRWNFLEIRSKNS